MTPQRTSIFAANWKMHKTRSEARDFLNSFVNLVQAVNACEIIICPPFTLLETVGEHLKGTHIKLGAQNVFYEEKGAFTGEIAPPMLKDLRCEYCIIGHSERRKYFGENDQNIHEKALALYRTGIRPIICVGELLEEREAGKTLEVLRQQIHGCLTKLPADKLTDTVIAYEPVWAIGTGRTATPEQAEEAQAFIRELINEMFGEALARQLRIQYGGSIKSSNIKSLMAMPNVDGGLVGGASLEPEEFSAIVRFAD